MRRRKQYKRDAEIIKFAPEAGGDVSGDVSRARGPSTSPFLKKEAYEVLGECI